MTNRKPARDRLGAFGPALLVLVVFFALPLLTLLSGSFERIDTGSFVITERLTLFNYRRFLFDGYYLSVLLTTLKMALLVTFTTLVTGYPLATYLTRTGPRERAALMLLIVSPLLVSVVIRSFGWIIILGPRGLINWVLQGAGLASTPVYLIYTETAVVIGLAHVFFPFMVLAIYAALRNIDGSRYTVRIDSKVVAETEIEGAKNDESRWMRFTLDTVGKREWPSDQQGRSVYPQDFEELARKLERPLHPPGRDVRCIVSVGMLTEGWDCNTVTHIVGLRPFMSQLLCEQVVGRALRRQLRKLERFVFVAALARIARRQIERSCIGIRF